MQKKIKWLWVEVRNVFFNGVNAIKKISLNFYLDEKQLCGYIKSHDAFFC
jgi:hypothetical protein